ncbi:MAG: hypothetical protein HY343_11870 [Lentisphaerae bacterium]|nr:hypothetical protein [Lentisphaerota bacterium]
MQKSFIGVSVLALSIALPALAAPPPGGPSPASAAMEKLAKVLTDRSFAAKVVCTMTPARGADANAKGRGQVPIEFLMTMSQGKSRTEMDFMKMAAAAATKDSPMPPGLDKMVTITRPDRNVIYQVVPGLKAYCEMPIPQPSAETGKSAAKLDRKVEGTESVEKYTCEKVLNTITGVDGKTMEVRTWEAKELKGLPVKVETVAPEGKMTMLFQDIKTEKPADSVFEIPSDYTKYADMGQLMMSGMMKMMPKPQ